MVYTCIEGEKVEVMVDLVTLDYIRDVPLDRLVGYRHLFLVTTDTNGRWINQIVHYCIKMCIYCKQMA